MSTNSLVRICPITGRLVRLTNLSVRAFVSASEPLIAGFVTSGADTTRVLARAIGPGLNPFGVADAMADPQLVARNGETSASNDNWDVSLAARFSEVGAFALAAGSKDAALESAVLSGNYTGIASSPTGDSGTTLLELYESAPPPAAARRFVNVSARCPVAPNRPLIVGFAITGEVPVTVLIRGAGPALAPFGVPAALADPQLTLYQSTTPLWDNDNWSSPSALAQTLNATFTRTGAFGFGANSQDSAMQVTLTPGS